MSVTASHAPHRTVHRRQALRRWFDAGVLFKGAEGALEVVAGAWLWFDPTILQSVVFRLTAKELLHDPDDRVVATLRHLAEELGSGRHAFATFYLIAHGIVKVVLAAGLLTQKRWAFPVAIWTLGAFVVYQLYRFTHTHSPMLPLLAAIDLGIIWLVWREGRVRAHERRRAAH
ncbi:MAG TPA: DUF2127 domain-containing protein [Casimicrobiaceae bacterium]|jgi:uncharacterized membrane protein